VVGGVEHVVDVHLGASELVAEHVCHLHLELGIGVGIDRHLAVGLDDHGVGEESGIRGVNPNGMLHGPRRQADLVANEVLASGEA
jgi:hypothetical protein